MDFSLLLPDFSGIDSSPPKAVPASPTKVEEPKKIARPLFEDLSSPTQPRPPLAPIKGRVKSPFKKEPSPAKGKENEGKVNISPQKAKPSESDCFLSDMSFFMSDIGFSAPKGRSSWEDSPAKSDKASVKRQKPRGKDAISMKKAPLTSAMLPPQKLRIDESEHPIELLGKGTQHCVHAFTGEVQKITFGTVKGPVTVESHKIALRVLLSVAVGPDPRSVRIQHQRDLAGYDWYVKNGLNVPKMFVRPDPCDSQELHPDTFVDKYDPKSGGFAIVEKVSTKISLEGVRTAASLSALPQESKPLMLFAIGEWKKFVRYMAKNAKSPYASFPESTALFDDFKPANVGRNEAGFCHLDPFLPDNPADRILFSSMREFVDGNGALFEEIFDLLMEDEELLKSLSGNTEKLALFKSALKGSIETMVADGRKENGGKFPLPKHKG